MLKNEKTLSNSTFHYLHDNQSIIISFPLRAQISRPHPPPWKIIDKSTFESKQEEERFSPSKKKASIPKTLVIPRKSPPSPSPGGPGRSNSRSLANLSANLLLVCHRVREPRAPHTWSRNTGEGARESAKPWLEPPRSGASGTIIAAALERGTERSWSFS